MKLTTKARNKLKGTQFALAGRRYPIENASHARNALARASQYATSEQQATIKEKVARKFPGIKQS